jgi:hypothetical protein
MCPQLALSVLPWGLSMIGAQYDLKNSPCLEKNSSVTPYPLLIEFLGDTEMLDGGRCRD